MEEQTILLVEDNLDHTVLVQALLDYHGLGRGVYVTQSVAEAKAYLRREWPFDDPARSPTPTLIILDHWLDDGTGLDLLHWLSDQPGLREIPVIVFTACTDPRVREEALALGAEDFLLKPNGYEELGSAIEKLVRPWSRERGPLRDGGAESAQAG